MHLVLSSKVLIQKLRECEWSSLLNKVTSFCEQHSIDIPNMSARYAKRARSRHQQDEITMEHHYRVDIFNAMIDSQLQELNHRFNEHVVELLILSSTLDPRDGYRSFNIDKICQFVDRFYLEDFIEQEKVHLRMQLQHYEIDVLHHPELQKLLTISELCQGLVRTRKSLIYPLVDRLIRLVLIFTVSTATE